VLRKKREWFADDDVIKFQCSQRFCLISRPSRPCICCSCLTLLDFIAWYSRKDRGRRPLSLPPIPRPSRAFICCSCLILLDFIAWYSRKDRGRRPPSLPPISDRLELGQLGILGAETCFDSGCCSGSALISRIGELALTLKSAGIERLLLLLL